MSSVKLTIKKQEEHKEREERKLLTSEARAVIITRLAASFKTMTLNVIRLAISCKAFVIAYKKVICRLLIINFYYKKHFKLYIPVN